MRICQIVQHRIKKQKTNSFHAGQRLIKPADSSMSPSKPGQETESMQKRKKHRHTILSKREQADHV
jgi:hypothetical protein